MIDEKLTILARGQQEIKLDIEVVREEVEELRHIVNKHDEIIKDINSTHAMTTEIHGYLANVKGFFKVVGFVSWVISKTWHIAVAITIGAILYWNGLPKVPK
jgi:hypothetical protein